jgi:hypothetical protein
MAVEAGLSFEKRRRFQYNLHFRFRDGGDNPSPRGHSRGCQRAYDHGNFAGKHPGFCRGLTTPIPPGPKIKWWPPGRLSKESS